MPLIFRAVLPANAQRAMMARSHARPLIAIVVEPSWCLGMTLINVAAIDSIRRYFRVKDVGTSLDLCPVTMDEYRNPDSPNSFYE
jgi:hypothetical protein